MVATLRTPAPGPGPETPEARLENWIAGRSPAARRLRERVYALAPLRIPVLITGEPGAGHDRVARALHAVGPHARAPFRVLRCGETDLRPDRAAGAVVYLDRVERLTARDQARWQSVLEAPPGAAARAPLRVVASSDDDAALPGGSGALLPGLAQRLARFTLHLPPLRDRPSDIAQLVPAFVERAGADLGRPACRVTAAALARLRTGAWPGNLRELADAVERLVAFAGHGEITAELVSDVLAEVPGDVAGLRAREARRQRDELVLLLEDCGGNLAEVARRLGLSRGAVIHRARRFGLLPGPRRRAGSRAASGSRSRANPPPRDGA